jgi:hypothetical protein
MSGHISTGRGDAGWYAVVGWDGCSYRETLSGCMVGCGRGQVRGEGGVLEVDGSQKFKALLEGKYVEVEIWFQS